MSSKRKSWQEKLAITRQPEVEKSDKDFAGIKKGQTMLIPTPRLVDEYVRHIPEGHKTSVETLRKDLAAAHGAEVTCPLTTGIFLRIVAEAAYEEYTTGKPINNITPFWRIIDANSNTAKKLTFGTHLLKAQQKAEGIG